MTESDLDAVYTRLCKIMTEIGEAQASLFLARFALLAINEIEQPEALHRLVTDASDGMTPATQR